MAKDEAAAKIDPASPEAVAEEAAAKGQKKAKKKQLMILLAAILGSLAIGGGGVAFYFITLKSKTPEAAPKAETAADEKAKTPVNTAVYISMPHLTAPLIDHDKVLGYVLLDLSLEVSDNAMQARVFVQLPALKAAFLEDVTQNPIGKADNPRVVDYDSLTKRLTDVANRELKDGHVNRVLVTQTIRM